MEKIKFEKRDTLTIKPTDQSSLGFGKIFTDYMVQIDYTQEQGWHDTRIIPYGPINIYPANVSLHYGQLIFEGLKAYRTQDGRIALFRPYENMKRLNRSGTRLCIPELDPELAVESLKELVRVEQDWIPTAEGCSLYIRPFTIATENFLGVHPSDTYSFFIILSPVGSYYQEGIAPIKIFVEDKFVRAVQGGTGEAKCAGNYGASLASQEKAEAEGYTQVLWLDGVERKYVEEIGTTNAFFVIGDEVVTPALNGSILPGITRDSTIQLLKHWGVPVTERRISIDEIVEAYHKGELKEAFATGTAAVVSPIGELKYKDTIMTLNNNQTGPIAQRVYDGITGIQSGKTEDPFGWLTYVD